MYINYKEMDNATMLASICVAALKKMEQKDTDVLVFHTADGSKRMVSLLRPWMPEEEDKVVIVSEDDVRLMFDSISEED